MAKDKQDQPAWIVARHGKKYRVIETSSNWVWRTLDTPGAAMAWIKAAAEPNRSR